MLKRNFLFLITITFVSFGSPAQANYLSSNWASNKIEQLESSGITLTKEQKKFIENIPNEWEHEALYKEHNGDVLLNKNDFEPLADKVIRAKLFIDKGLDTFIGEEKAKWCKWQQTIFEKEARRFEDTDGVKWAYYQEVSHIYRNVFLNDPSIAQWRFQRDTAYLYSPQFVRRANSIATTQMPLTTSYNIYQLQDILQNSPVGY